MKLFDNFNKYLLATFCEYLMSLYLLFMNNAQLLKIPTTRKMAKYKCL